MKPIHPQFKLNGIPLERDSLMEVAYSWVKEGEDFEVLAGDFLLDWLSPSKTVYVKTSGSTGQPKTLEIKKEAMVNSALATGQYFDLKPGDLALLCLSSQHIAGKMMLVRAIILGLHLDMVAPSSSPLEGIQKEYDFCAMVPLQVQNSLEPLYKIKTLIIGGAPISKLLRAKLAEQPNDIYETYGMTETVTHIAVKKVSSMEHSPKETYFKTLPSIQISKDERGCLVIDAPKIAENPIVTNDLVDIEGEHHFKWLGRHDNVINSGGVKLIPEQIEEKLLPVVESRFFVSGIPDEQLGEKLVLFIEGEEPSQFHSKTKIQEVKSLERYEVPKQIVFIKNFAETPNGKIQRKEVKSQYLNR